MRVYGVLKGLDPEILNLWRTRNEELPPIESFNWTESQLTIDNVMDNIFARELAELCVAALSPLTSAVFLRYTLSGETLQDLSEEFGITKTDVRRRIARAKRKLVSLLLEKLQSAQPHPPIYIDFRRVVSKKSKAHIEAEELALESQRRFKAFMNFKEILNEQI
jgi:hypothetical protein